MNIQRTIHSLLEQENKVQWRIYLTILLVFLTLSIWQQYNSIMTHQSAIIEDIAALKRSNTMLSNTLHHRHNRQPAHQLSNDQIASMFGRLRTEDNAQVTSLEFLEEKNNRGIHLTRIKAELLVSIVDVFTLLDSDLGKSLFIESLTLRRYDQVTIQMLLELVQPTEQLQ